MKKVGAAWKSCTPMEKKPFEDVAKADKATYQAKFAEYKASGKADAWKRDPAKPKKPLTPFFQWSTAERKSPSFASVYGKLSMAEVTKAMAKQFKVLPATQTAAMQAQFKSDMEKYKVAMEKYKSSGAEDVWLEKTGRLDAKKKAEEKKTKEEEKKKIEKEKATAKLKAAKEKAALKKEKEKAAKAKKAAAAKEKEAKAKAAKLAKAAKAKTAKK